MELVGSFSLANMSYEHIRTNVQLTKCIINTEGDMTWKAGECHGQNISAKSKWIETYKKTRLGGLSGKFGKWHGGRMNDKWTTNTQLHSVSDAFTVGRPTFLRIHSWPSPLASQKKHIATQGNRNCTVTKRLWSSCFLHQIAATLSST